MRKDCELVHGAHTVVAPAEGEGEERGRRRARDSDTIARVGEEQKDTKITAQIRSRSQGRQSWPARLDESCSARSRASSACLRLTDRDHSVGAAKIRLKLPAHHDAPTVQITSAINASRMICADERERETSANEQQQRAR